MKNPWVQQAASVVRAPNTFDEEKWRNNDTAWWYVRAHMFLDPVQDYQRTIIGLHSRSAHAQIGREVSLLVASPLKLLQDWFRPRKHAKEPDESPLSNFYADVTDPHATQPMAITMPMPLVDLVEMRR
jgi:hypothetical protein